MKISIVAPVRNEEENIPILLQKIADALWGISYEVVFVDDSTDATPVIIQKATLQSLAPIKMEHREGKKGLASAVLRGFQLAEGEYIAVMDADLQHPPFMLRNMYCAMLHGADLCLPSRFIADGGDGGLKGYRRIVSAVARILGKIIIGRLRPLSDPTGGLFMVRRELLQGAELKPIGWKILAEVMTVCPCVHIIEIPYVFQRRNSGESKLSIRVTLEYLRQLLSLLKRENKSRNIEVERWTGTQSLNNLNELEGELICEKGE